MRREKERERHAHTTNSETERKREDRERNRMLHQSVATNSIPNSQSVKIHSDITASTLSAEVHHGHVGEEKERGWGGDTSQDVPLDRYRIQETTLVHVVTKHPTYASVYT